MTVSPRRHFASSWKLIRSSWASHAGHVPFRHSSAWGQSASEFSNPFSSHIFLRISLRSSHFVFPVIIVFCVRYAQECKPLHLLEVLPSNHFYHGRLLRFHFRLFVFRGNQIAGKAFRATSLLQQQMVGNDDVENVILWACTTMEAIVTYDNEGNIYGCGSNLVKLANNPEYSDHDSGVFTILSGVPMRLSIRIEGVSTSAESIARITLPFECQAWGLNSQKPVKITNIPITRD